MRKILVVDDDPALVDFLKLLLESEGYETFEAYEGKTALAQIAEHSPEVVLLDYMMPNMHGLEVLRRVTEKFHTTFVIMLTGKGSEEVAAECMRAGAADYVVKPFDNDHLVGVIRNVLKLRDVRIQMLSQQEEINSLLNTALSRLESVPPNPTIEEAIALLKQLRSKL